MSKLETYNRVATLESQLIKRLLIAGYIILLLGAILGFGSYLLLAQPWRYTMALSVGALVICLLILYYDSRRPRRCRFCHSPLGYVVRPLYLSQHYLAMEGRKVGDSFFTRKKRGPFGQERWVKLSNQSLACHHCRVSEEKSRVVEETPDASELKTVTGNRASSRSDQ